MFEEIEDEKGYRYFLNRDGKKQKECPILISIIKNIKANFHDIKYSTYRCVVKLKKLKRELFTYCISYRNVVSIIQKHKNGSTQQQSISPKQLTDIVYDIFYATQKAGFYFDNKAFRLEMAVTILTNFLWNIFDSKRMQNISLMEFKLTMLVLCDLEPLNTFNQIIDAHFEMAKDFNHCITKPRFEEFINIFGKILSYLGEPLYFDQKVISDILAEAFLNSPGINGICQYNFYSLWTDKLSKYTIIFLLLIRFKKSESIIHQNECAGCKKFPITGLRYKCQKCKGMSLCFKCFSKGFTNKRHSFGHRFYELTSNEKEHGKMCSILLKFLKIFQRQSNTASLNQSLHSTHDQHAENNGNTKLIEDEHIELVQIDDDMECGTSIHYRQRRGTIRSEIFNNSENLLILQRNLMDKLLNAVENLKSETESFQKMSNENKKIIASDTEFEKYLNSHGQFLFEQVEILKQIHQATIQSFSSNQNNKTIKSFSTPTKSIFLPSSTPYNNPKEKPKLMVDPILANSINGYELNKSYVAKDEEYSISDISTFFQTKIPSKQRSNNNNNGLKRNDLDQTESKIENFKRLFAEVKDIIDGECL
ncbi:hypothetical protein ACKWTF_000164 [Chironomus riparius]